MHKVCFNSTSRTRTAVDREALVHLIIKNCKWEQFNWAEKMLKTDVYQRLRNVALKVNGPKLRKFVNPSMKSMARIVVAITALVTNSPELNGQLKEGLLGGCW